MTPSFSHFGVSHLAALAAIALLCAGVVTLARRAHSQAQQHLGRSLALFLVIFRLAEIPLHRVYINERWETLLPLHICSVSIFLGAYVLWTRSDRVFQVVYYWVAAGTTQALVTPDLHLGFPHLHFFTYFIGHGTPVLAVAYAIGVYRLWPRLASVFTAVMATWLLMLLVTPINLALDANYLFLMKKPEGASLLDYLGPWPWYLVWSHAVGIPAFALVGLPFHVMGKQRRRAGGGGYRAPTPRQDEPQQ